MANIKISQLQEMSDLPANTGNLLFVVTDTTPTNPISRKLKFSTLYDYIDNFGQSAFDQANAAFTYANTVSSNANVAFVQANSAYITANSAGTYANLAYGVANAALSIVVTAPETPLGNTGDKAGQVYLTNTAIYYCTSTYDGNTNIWSKIVSTDAW